MSIEESVKAGGWKGEGEVTCSRYIEICKTEYADDICYQIMIPFKNLQLSGSKIVDVFLDDICLIWMGWTRLSVSSESSCTVI